MLIPLPMDGRDDHLEVRLLHAGVRRHSPQSGERGVGPLVLGHALFTFIVESENRIFSRAWDFTLGAGDAMIIGPGDRFTARFGPGKTLVVINVHFEVTGAARRRLFQLLPRCVRAEEDTSALRRAMEACCTALERRDNALARAELASGLVELGKIRIRRSRNALSRSVQMALEFIREHAEGPVTRKDVSRACSVSPSHLSEIVRQQTGITLSEHIRRARIERAKEMMRTTSMNFSEIAEQLGMELYGFSRLFKKVTGASPTAYCRAAEFGRIRRDDK